MGKSRAPDAGAALLLGKAAGAPPIPAYFRACVCITGICLVQVLVDSVALSGAFTHWAGGYYIAAGLVAIFAVVAFVVSHAIFVLASRRATAHRIAELHQVAGIFDCKSGPPEGVARNFMRAPSFKHCHGDSNDRSLLHLAVCDGDLEGVAWLVGNNAVYVDQRDAHGDTALDLARFAGRGDMIELLASVSLEGRPSIAAIAAASRQEREEIPVSCVVHSLCAAPLLISGLLHIICGAEYTAGDSTDLSARGLLIVSSVTSAIPVVVLYAYLLFR